MIGRRGVWAALLLGWFACVAGFFSSAWADAEGILVDVSRREVAVGETLRVTIRLTNLNVERFEPELPSAFEVEGRSTQSAMSMALGGEAQTTRSQILSVRALQEGSFRIGPFRVKSNGKTFDSNVVSVVVQPSSAARTKGEASQPSSKSVFLTAEVSNKNPWQHERIDYTLRFYYRTQVSNPKLTEGDLSGFDVFENKDARQSESETTVQGVSYRVVEIHKYISPRNSGKIVLPASRLVVDVLQPRERTRQELDDPTSAFDDFFQGSFGQRERVALSSEPLVLEVKPLPSPAPAGWTNAVGSVALSHDLSKSVLTVGESATLTVRLEGKADLAAVEVPNLQVPGVKVYPDRPALERRFEPGGGVVDTRIFKIGLVPVKSGEIKIPEIPFSYFNTANGKYETISIRPTVMQVSGGGDEATPLEAPKEGPSAQAVKLQGSDILLSHDDPVEMVRDERVSRGVVLRWFSIPLLLLLTWMGCVVRDRRAERRGAKDPVVRARKALRQWQKASRHLLAKVDSAAVGQPNLTPLYAEFSSAVKSFVGDRGRGNGASQTPDETAVFLRERGISEALARQVKEKLAHAEMCQFVVGAGSVADFRVLVQDCDALLRSVDKEWV